ncbi:MAG: EamA family transporter, partial [Enterococcus viikkiensis]
LLGEKLTIKTATGILLTLMGLILSELPNYLRQKRKG